MGKFLLLISLASAAMYSIAADVLVLDSSGTGTTGKFRVLDREVGAFMSYKTAEVKFLESASSASIKIDEESVTVVIDCPVPADMHPVRDSSRAWAGDGVEFFLRPYMDKGHYFQYSANAAGVFNAQRCYAPGQKDVTWNTRGSAEVRDVDNGFRVTFRFPWNEVFQTRPKDGDLFALNFTRCGKTCGGLSTWSDVGRDFANVAGFGKAIVGGLRVYAKNRLSKLLKTYGTSSAFATAAVQIAELSKDVSSFDVLEVELSGLERRLLINSLGNPSLFLFAPENPWGDDFCPKMGMKPLAKLSVKSRPGTRVVVPFAIENFRDTSFVGQLKFVDRPEDTCAYNLVGNKPEGLASRFSLYHTIGVMRSSGTVVHDALVTPSMDTLLRLGSGERSAIFAELDTRGMANGHYTTFLKLKKASAGYENIVVPVEADIVGEDIARTAVDRSGYDELMKAYRPGGCPLPRVSAHFADRGYNMIYLWCGRLDFFARRDSDGAWSVDFTAPDGCIADRLRGGLDPNRAKLLVFMCMGASLTDGCPKRSDGSGCAIGTSEFAEGLSEFLRLSCLHFKEKFGIRKENIYWYPVDEPSGDMYDETLKSTLAKCYSIGKTIKGFDAGYVTMVNPRPTFMRSDAFDKVAPELLKYYDVIELYRPYLTSSKTAFVKSLLPREIWTYSILDSSSGVTPYRNDYWRNMRDGFREVTTYWHITDSAGGDGFDPVDSTRGSTVDYGTLHVDFDRDTYTPTRRQLAADMGYEESKLILSLRRKFAGNRTKLSEIESIVKRAADIGTMAAMDEGRERLLDIR